MKKYLIWIATAILAPCFVNEARAQNIGYLQPGGGLFMNLNPNTTSSNAGSAPNSTIGFINPAYLRMLVKNDSVSSQTIYGFNQRSYNGAQLRTYSISFAENTHNNNNDSPTIFFIGVKEYGGAHSLTQAYQNQNDFRGLAGYAGLAKPIPGSETWTFGFSLMVARSSFPDYSNGKLIENIASTAGGNASISFNTAEARPDSVEEELFRDTTEIVNGKLRLTAVKLGTIRIKNNRAQYEGSGYHGALGISNIGAPFSYGNTKAFLPAEVFITLGHTGVARNGNEFLIGVEIHKSLSPIMPFTAEDNAKYQSTSYFESFTKSAWTFSYQLGMSYQFRMHPQDKVAFIPSWGYVVDNMNKFTDGINIGFGVSVANRFRVDVGKFFSGGTPTIGTGYGGRPNPFGFYNSFIFGIAYTPFSLK